jgi:hypothetical protein
MDSGGGCGAMYAAGMCEGVMQEGTDDPTCPDEDSRAGTVLKGCCKMGNKCGVRSASLMGCVERSDYPVQFLFTMTMGVDPPPLAAMACGGDGMDAGTE